MKNTVPIFVFGSVFVGILGSECETCRLGYEACIRPPHVNSEADSYCLECSQKRSKCGTPEQMEGCHLFCQESLRKELAVEMDRLNITNMGMAAEMDRLNITNKGLAAEMDRFNITYRELAAEMDRLKASNSGLERQNNTLSTALWSVTVVAAVFLLIIIMGLVEIKLLIFHRLFGYLVSFARNKRHGTGQLDPERDPDETSRMVPEPEVTAAPEEPLAQETSTQTGPETPACSPSCCPGYKKLTQIQPTETTAEKTYAIG